MIDALSTLNVFSTFILAVLTGVYVYLTRRLLQETQRTNDSSRQALERQFRLQTFPQLFCQLALIENRLAVTVVNSSNNIAYDVDVVVVTVWTEEEMTIADFLSKYVHQDHHDIAPRVSKDGFYGVFDRSWYPLFRTRSKVSFVATTPICGPPVNILLQFRDSFGTNYSQHYWFTPTDEIDETAFRLSSLDPPTPSPIPRLTWGSDLRLKPNDKTKIPDQLREFARLFNATVSSGILKRSNRDIEDRGVWEPL